MQKIKVWCITKKSFYENGIGIISPGINEIMPNKVTQLLKTKNVVEYKEQDKTKKITKDKPFAKIYKKESKAEV